MKYPIYSFLLVILFVGGVFIDDLFAKDADILAHITYLQGTVVVKKANSTKWTTAVLKQGLSKGDYVQTKNSSRIEIKFQSGSILRIDSNSTLEITELKKDDKSLIVKTKLWLGQLWSHVIKLNDIADTFETETPTTTAAVRGTVYRSDVQKDHTTEVVVYEGEVAVSPPPPDSTNQENQWQGWDELEEIEGPKEVTVKEWVQIVRAMQKVVVTPDGKKPAVQDLTSEDKAQEAKNDWVQFNQKRDQELFE